MTVTLNKELYQDYYRLTSKSVTCRDLLPHVGVWTLSLNGLNKRVKNLALGAGAISKSFFQTTFSRITSVYRGALDQFLAEKNKFSKENAVNFYCNLMEWNLKIEKRNEKIETSKLWALAEKILKFISFSRLTFKYTTIDLSPLNAHIWQLDLAERARRAIPPPTAEQNWKRWPLDLIERARRAIPQPFSQQSSRVDWKKWFAKNQKDYIAHAVNRSQVDQVMQSGKIAPSEALLRQNGKVFHEGNLGESFQYRETQLIHPEIVLKMTRLTPSTYDRDEMIKTGIGNDNKTIEYSQAYRNLTQYIADLGISMRLPFGEPSVFLQWTIYHPYPSIKN